MAIGCFVTVLEGINDFGLPAFFPVEQVSAADVMAGYKQLITRAHAHGLLIYGATLTPFEGTTIAGYFTAAGEVKRQAVNTWIRTSRAFDAVIDFDRAIRDPAHPTRMLAAYDSGDHLHPNDAGYRGGQGGSLRSQQGGRRAARRNRLRDESLARWSEPAAPEVTRGVCATVRAPSRRRMLRFDRRSFRR